MAFTKRNADVHTPHNLKNHPSMKTLVINLPQSTDRLRSLNEQLNAHPYLDVEVIEAVDGRRLSPEETDRAFDSRRFRRHYHRNPRPGEIGCTLSHQKAYRRIKETGVNTLILEDDIHILRDMRNELKEVDEWLSSDRPRLLVRSAEQAYIEEDTSTILTPSLHTTCLSLPICIWGLCICTESQSC